MKNRIKRFLKQEQKYIRNSLQDIRTDDTISTIQTTETTHDMLSYKNKLGRSISIKEWGALLEKKEYSRVALSVLKNGKRVSTVWLGLNHGSPDHPLYFETMVFNSKGEELCERYETLEQAEMGHKRIVADLSQSWIKRLINWFNKK